MTLLKKSSPLKLKILKNFKNLWQYNAILNFNAFHSSTVLLGQPKLSPLEVTNILRENEFAYDFNDQNNSVKSYDSNQLPANLPIEDTHSEGKCLLTQGVLIGVFDGHGGPACAQVVAKRLFNYICASLLPYDLLKQYCASLEGTYQPINLIEQFNEKYEIVPELQVLYHKSLIKYVKDLLSNRNDFRMEEALEKAILSLDDDISREAIECEESTMNSKTISVAMSGAVACIAHIDGSHLHIANVGDCRAVLGVLTEENTWLAKQLTEDHTVENIKEVNRIKQEHPPCEKDTVIRQNRLLGQLIPLRAFGDVRYKWNMDVLMKIAAPIYGDSVIAPGYHTPPYLTSKPEVTHHRLTSRDKFMIIASDGLWDMMSPLQAVRIVGEHMRGKVVLNHFKLPKARMKLKDINYLLLQRKECFNIKPTDQNAATYLLRNALGGTDFGFEHNTLSRYLSLPQEIVRNFRDDITITVVYFNSECLRRVLP